MRLFILLLFSSTCLAQKSDLFNSSLMDMADDNGAPVIWAYHPSPEDVKPIIYRDSEGRQYRSQCYIIPTDSITKVIINHGNGTYMLLSATDKEFIIIDFQEGNIEVVAQGTDKAGDYKLIRRNGKIRSLMFKDDEGYILPQY